FGSSVPESTAVTQDVKLYPNPAQLVMTVECSSSLVGQTISIYGFDGKLVKEEKITSEKYVMDLSGIASGQYWTSMSSALGTVTRCFVKE
ncbi:MAG: T9SS type A sorting domain-containing protein, partial [Flavobacteriales bacterium]